MSKVGTCEGMNTHPNDLKVTQYIIQHVDNDRGNHLLALVDGSIVVLS